MECNGPLREEADPPDRPADVGGPFTRCGACGRLFWAGSHVGRIVRRLSRARDRAGEMREEEARGAPPPFERMEYDAFLREALDLLGLSWRGYRRVRFGLRVRVRRRLGELGLRALPEYLSRLRRDARERSRLGELLHVTVSRFFRDRETWLRLPETVFPDLARAAGDRPARVWSLGCASGEEPFTLQMMWAVSPFRDRPLETVGADLAEDCLRRAREAVYPESSVHTVPEPYLSRFFRREGASYVLDRAIADAVLFERFDWRDEEWPGPFDWVLARNGVFTYLGAAGRERAFGKIVSAIRPGGFLWIGGNERLPREPAGWNLLAPGLFRVRAGEAPDGA
jgi:chemotaxis methyl-accepting protein methylase